MNFIKTVSSYLLILTFFLYLGCSDSSTSPEEGGLAPQNIYHKKLVYRKGHRDILRDFNSSNNCVVEFVNAAGMSDEIKSTPQYSYKKTGKNSATLVVSYTKREGINLPGVLVKIGEYKVTHDLILDFTTETGGLLSGNSSYEKISGKGESHFHTYIKRDFYFH